MNSLRKLVWLAYIVVGVLLAIIILLGANQYLLSGRYSQIIEQSERAIFQFATIRELVTESLIDRSWDRLESAVPEIEKLNSEISRLQENTLIPTELKLAMVEKVDLAGIIISVRRLVNGTEDQAESKRLQEQMRSIADHLLQYDRIIVSQSRGRLLNFQMIIIGAMGLIISLASFSLNRLYKNTVVPLLHISNQLQSDGQLTQEISCGPDVCREVADIIDTLKNLENGHSTEIPRSNSGREVELSLVEDMVNETTNQLNGIINYAQLLADEDNRDLSQDEKEMLQKIIDSGVSIAQNWQKIT